MNKIRWGIMGTGRIAGIFCDMLHKLEHAEIYAVASRTEGKALEFGSQYKAQKCYGSYEELVQDADVDIVYVATPIACHYDNVKLCLLAGKGVLCEKAFVQTVAEAEELYALAKEKNVFLMEAMWTKCQPIFRRIMTWKKEGKFGEIQGVEARFYTAATKEHRLIKQKSQGGVVMDLLIYPLMYACALLGYEPKEVRAVAVKGGDDNIDVMDSVQLLYENGSFASLVSGLAQQKMVSLYIHGTKGRVLLEEEYMFQAQKAVLYDWNNHPIEKVTIPFYINGYEYEAIEAMNCIAEGKIQSELVPMEETIAILRLLEKCKEQWQ